MIKLTYTIVFVSDMARSVKFYRDTLGLPLRFESPKWTEFDTGGVTLALHGSEPHSSAAAAMPPFPPAHSHPGLNVHNLDEFHQRMTAAGVRCIQPPKTEEFGGKLAAYADPDGLAISVAQMLDSR